MLLTSLKKPNNDIENIALLDSAEYYNIFLGKKLNTQLLYYMNSECLKHIVLTRKIQIGQDIMSYVERLKFTESEIKQFFSFYTHDEIVKINDTRVYGFSFFIYNKSYYYWTFLIVMLLKNKLAFNYIESYYARHNLSILPTNTKKKYPARSYNINSLSYCYDKIINDHEQSILLFQHSLRYCWIESCIYS